MNFDPMTGEPIKPEEEEMNFDPMTGEPIQKSEAQPEQSAQVETPVEQEVSTETEETTGSEAVYGFDPMTGEPIHNPSALASNPNMNFDPMTGEPIYNAAPKKKGIFKPVLGVVAGVAVVGIVAFAGIKSGIFLGKGDKVLVAVSNTVMEETHLSKDFAAFAKNLASDKFTMTMSLKAGGEGGEIEYSQKSNDKQLKGEVEIDNVDIEFIGLLDENKLSVQVPSFIDTVFTYNYKKKKDGYLVEEAGEDTIEALDNMLNTLYSAKEQKNMAKDVSKDILSEYKDLKFEKVSKEEYEVDGKDRKCKGYKTTITGENIQNVIENIEKIIDEEYGEVFQNAGAEIEDTYDDIMDVFDDVSEEFDDMPDIDATFYIYKNKLACINLDDEIEIQFLGGDTRMQNMKICVEDKDILEIKGHTDSETEKLTLYEYDKKVASMEYDYKEGSLEIESAGSTINAEIDVSRKGATFRLEDISGSFDDVDFEISVNKGAKIQKLDGEEFDIGNASEDDFEDIVEDIEDTF